jgi:ribonuclease P/MRP protein subunit POP5
MGTRPPTLREKRRYLLVALEPAGTAIDQKELYYALSEATTQLWGDAMAAVITPAVVASEGQFFIIRCRRGTEHELATALSTIISCRDTRIALRMIAASGTIESLRGKMPAGKTPGQELGVPTECRFDKKMYQVIQCNGQKVDVIEKGFKNTNRLFLTREDMEEL